MDVGGRAVRADASRHVEGDRMPQTDGLQYTKQQTPNGENGDTRRVKTLLQPPIDVRIQVLEARVRHQGDHGRVGPELRGNL